MHFEEKTELSTAIINKIGSKVEEMIESAEREQYKAVGARSALLKHVDNLINLSKSADDELEKSIEDIETLKLVKSWLFKAITATKNFADHYINLELSCIGEGTGYKATHDLLQKMSKEIKEKAASIRHGLESGDVVVGEDGSLESTSSRRPPGVRPSGQTIKQQRLAEEAAKGGNGVDTDNMSPEELEAHLMGE